MRSFLTRLVLGVLTLGVLPVAANAATTHFGPSAYLQSGDTPAGFACAECVLSIEDFEDNSLDPFLTIDHGQILPPNFVSGMGPSTDSVDGDDGAVDGSGLDGYSYFSGNRRDLTITFDSLVKSAGLVFTDGDNASTNIRLEAFDINGGSLGVIDAGDLADDSFNGQTAEDRFLGFQDMDGSISSIKISMDAGSGIEIDHIHWQDHASCVPEPTSAGLAMVALIALFGVRRRR